MIDSLAASHSPEVGYLADTLTITDNRTGKSYEVPIKEGTIRATDLRQIKSGDDDFGLMTYDPAFMNTAACRSSIHYNAHPMGMLIAMISALGTFYPEAKNINDPVVRLKQIERLIAKMITIAA